MLATPYPFHAVGLYYQDFDQTTDEEVVEALRRAKGVRGAGAAVQGRAVEEPRDERLDACADPVVRERRRGSARAPAGSARPRAAATAAATLSASRAAAARSAWSAFAASKRGIGRDQTTLSKWRAPKRPRA